MKRNTKIQTKKIHPGILCCDLTFSILYGINISPYKITFGPYHECTNTKMSFDLFSPILVPTSPFLANHSLCYINCYTTESRFCYIEIVTTECNMNSDKMESLFHCITIYVVESYFCCASFSKKNDFVAQRKFDSIIHYVTKSYFCYTFLIDLHLYNIIMILRCNFFAHLATQ